jgi:hypothetical protein
VIIALLGLADGFITIRRPSAQPPPGAPPASRRPPPPDEM